MGYLDNSKISSSEITANHVQAAPDTLIGTAQNNKEVFDKLAELMASKHNSAIDSIDAKDTTQDTRIAAIENEMPGFTSAVNTATDNAITATTNANTATTNANTATKACETATANSVSATKDAQTATSNAITAKTNCETATGNTDAAIAACNTAKASCDTATANAVKATDSANSAATSANSAAASATSAKTACEEATTNATKATTACNTATNNADTAATAANTATANANTATSAANTATSNAVTATNNANAATSNATSAANSANTAATAANAATDAANTATTNATAATSAANTAPKYVWIKYSTDSAGSSFHTPSTPADKYVGVAVTSANAAPADKTGYTWSLFKGADGQGSGDMLKFVYDTDDNGIVDKATADKDGNELSTTYAKSATVTSDIATAKTAAISEAKTYTDTGLSGKEEKATISAATMSASGWSSSEYSFESLYPASTYDIEIQPNGDSITTAQMKAWTKAKILGSITANKAIATGTAPEVDIPVILKVVHK